jgi:hypothetical protein
MHLSGKGERIAKIAIIAGIAKIGNQQIAVGNWQLAKPAFAVTIQLGFAATKRNAFRAECSLLFSNFGNTGDYGNFGNPIYPGLTDVKTS